MKEIWKPIVGFEGHYEVSSLGRMRSVTRTVGQRLIRGRILTPAIDGRGYLNIRLYVHGRVRGATKKVHRIVMEAFVGPPNGLHVNHIDSVRDHNRLDNLEYVTRSQNMQHCVRSGRWGGSWGKNGNHVRAKRVDNDLVFMFHGMGLNHSQIAREMGNVSRQTVRTILRGEHWTQHA